MAFLLSLGFSLTSLIIYLFLTLLGSSLLVWISAVILSLSLLIYIFRQNLESFNLTKNSLSLKNLSFLLIILIFVFAKAYVLSPFILSKTVDSFKHLQITSVGDYYKHSFVVTVLGQDGIPPAHPYFPEAKLSYYYGYYLIPAFLYKVFQIFPNYAFYFFFIATDILGLLIILNVLKDHIKKYPARVLTFLAIIFGAGVNIFPEIWARFPLFGVTLNENIFASTVGFQLINTFKAFLYVPQHFFASCLSIGLINQLIFKKPRILVVAISTAFVLLSSVFVSWTLGIWLFLIFIFSGKLRKSLFISGVLTLIFILPFILQISERENILSLNKYQPVLFFTNFLSFLNPFFTALIQYGPITFVFAVLGIFYGRRNPVFILGFILPLILTWVLRSPNFNDFSMRGLMPLQLALPILYVKVFEQIKNRLFKAFLVALLFMIVIAGFYGFYLEYVKHWKGRMILHPNISELIYKIREYPESEKLSALDRDRWVEFIPSLGFKKVLSPFLFDSYVYFVGDSSIEHGQYERQAIELFIEHSVGKSLDELIEQKNMQLSKLFTFFDKYSSDWIIVNNQIWVKKDLNPWLIIFSEMNVESKSLTANFTLINYQSLIEKLSNYKISVGKEGLVIPVADKKFPLKKGLWYLASCSLKKDQLSFELQDYYLIFNEKMDGENKLCAGKIFYLQEDEDVRLMHTSNIEVVYAYPLKIESN